ncbi:unnamed protein product, partial [Rotaria socialis]
KFSPMANFNSISLTRKYFEQVTNSIDGSLSKNDELVDDRTADDAATLSFSNDIDDSDDNKKDDHVSFKSNKVNSWIFHFN